jgi:hypothetical protein
VIQHGKKHAGDDEKGSRYSMKNAKSSPEQGRPIDMDFGMKNSGREDNLGSEEDFDSDRCGNKVMSILNCFG